MKYCKEGKNEASFVPIDIIDVGIFKGCDSLAIQDFVVGLLNSKKKISDMEFPLGRRLLKINTKLFIDGYPWVLAGKSDGNLELRSMMSFVPSADWERYIRRLESVAEKMSKNDRLIIDENYDHVSVTQNVALYEYLAEVLASPRFVKMPSSQNACIRAGKSKLTELPVKGQISALLEIIRIIKSNRASTCDMRSIGGSGKASHLKISANVSNWKKSYTDARIVSEDFSGMFASKSMNLLNLL